MYTCKKMTEIHYIFFTMQIIFPFSLVLNVFLKEIHVIVSVCECVTNHRALIKYIQWKL